MQSNSIIAFGVFPSPISGQTVAFKKFTDFLKQNFNVYQIDISPKKTNRNLIFKSIKTFKWLIGIFKLIPFSYQKNIIYLSYDSGSGFYLDFLTQLIGKLLGFKFVIHHHSYSYINEKKILFQLAIKIIKKSSLHIFLCEKMKKDFHNTYTLNNGLVLNNWFFLEEKFDLNKVENEKESTIVKLGMLSNLSIEKGLDKAIETVKMLNNQKFRTELLLAGPLVGKEEEKLKKNILNSNSCNYIKFLGPIYGEDKTNFFNDIDIFLFPTNYKNEAMPLVLLEALASDSYIISAERGCIKNILTPYDSLIINDINMYVEEAVKKISTLQKSNISQSFNHNQEIVLKDYDTTKLQLENIILNIEGLMK